MKNRINIAVSFCLFAAATFTLSSISYAQNPRDPRLDHMQRLGFLTGNWKGMGWIELLPGNRVQLSGQEVVRSQLGGRVIQIEGDHSNSLDGSGSGIRRVSDSSVELRDFVIISYEPKTDRYLLRLYRPDGSYTDSSAALTAANTVQWEYKQATHLIVRLKIAVDGNGLWSQTREFTTDGKNWRTYFKMTLERQSD